MSKPSVPVPKITWKWLMQRCTKTEDGCLVWNRYIAINKGRDVPKAKATKDSPAMQVRRLVWRLKTGQEPQRADHIVRTCDTWGCVGCIDKRRPGDALRGKPVPLTQRVNVAAGQRALGRSHLTMELAREIRASPLSIEKEAALRGVGETTIAEIRRGTRWRDYDSPFIQLLP